MNIFTKIWCWLFGKKKPKIGHRVVEIPEPIVNELVKAKVINEPRRRVKQRTRLKIIRPDTLTGRNKPRSMTEYER